MGKRTAATDVALRALDGEIQRIEAQCQELADAPAGPGDALGDVDAIGTLEIKRIVLERRKQGLQRRRIEEEILDVEEQLAATEQKMLEHAGAAYAAAARRTQRAARLDVLIPELGNLLREMQGDNDEIQQHICAAINMAPGDASYHRRATFHIIVRGLVDGTFAGPALAGKLLANGLGKVGIPMQLAVNYVTLTVADASVAQAMRDAETRLRHQFSSWLCSCIASARPEPAPVVELTAADRRQLFRPFTELTAEEGFDAALVAAGVKGDSAEDRLAAHQPRRAQARVPGGGPVARRAVQ